MRLKKGLFIVFDGTDGTGKSTQARLLKSWLKKKVSNPVFLTHEPSNSLYGRKIKKLVMDKSKKLSKNQWYRLFTLDRKEHMGKEIIPALRQGKIVVSDRYYYSTMAYQLKPNEWETYSENFIKPDIAFIFSLPLKEALKRVVKRYSGDEAKKTSFENIKILKEVRRNFLLVPKVLNENVIMVDASQSIKDVFEQIKRHINHVIKQKNEIRITISGTPGSGKTTVARFLASRIGVKFCSVGEMARKIALRKEVSVDELSVMALRNRKIDLEIDSVHKKMKGSFVLDSRIAFYFFPESFSIFLYCKPEIAGKRIWKDKRKTEKFGLIETINEVKRRIKTDLLRYKKNYGIDISKLDNYDLVIDTSKIDEDKVNNLVLKAARKLYL